jgi:hypothetical protein
VIIKIQKQRTKAENLREKIKKVKRQREKIRWRIIKVR